MQYKLSNYIHISRDEEVLPHAFYLYATRSGAAIEIENAHYENILGERWDALPRTILSALIGNEAIVPANEDELAYILRQNKENIKDTDEQSLSFTIQPTANCQLGCHYCGQQHVKAISSTETNTEIVSRIISKAEQVKDTLKGLFITWYGGEPLTGLSSIEEMSLQLIEYCQSNNIPYSSSIVTNGLSLKPKTFEKLVDVFKVTQFQITLDGTAEYHDKRRMLKNGEPSFDIIFNNLKEIVHSDFFAARKPYINIRSNVDAQNKNNVFELLALMHQEGILSKVNFSPAPIHDWGDNGASEINGISKEEFAMFEIDVMVKKHEYGLLRKQGLIPLKRYNVCMVANAKSEVYDAYGNVSTCWEIPYTPVFDNTEYYSGNLLKTPDLDTTGAIMRNWFDEIPTNDTWCKSCNFLPVCGGSCPKHWNAGTVPCPSFKHNIDERLFLTKLLSIQEKPVIN